MKISRTTISTFCCLLALVFALSATVNAAQHMTRTLKDKPAIVLTAFGTSTRAEATYKVLEAQVREAFPDNELRWAFTSEIIRERVNHRRAKAGKTERLLSLQQALANLEAEGFKKVVVQPIHIFPGEEYEEVLGIVSTFPGLAIETGETLLQRWETLREVIHVLSADFLPPGEGCNVVVSHGTPSTHIASNITYMGLDRHLLKNFTNVYLGSVEGVVTREDGLDAAKLCAEKRVRFIPLMYVAGDHIMNDIMGEEEDPDDPSWKTEMEQAGFTTEITTVEHLGEKYYKGLGFFAEVNHVFISDIQRALARL